MMLTGPEQNTVQSEVAGGEMFSLPVCRRAMRMAIASACFGTLSQVMVGGSSIVILYAGMLGASRFVSLCTSSMMFIVLCLTYIPLAYIMGRVGKKRLVIPAVGLAMVGLLLAASAAWCGQWATVVLLGGLCIFSFANAVYIAGWFPMLRDVVPEDERGRFFGRLRISWQSVAAVFLAVSALIVKWNSSVWILQSIIAIAAVFLIGRIVFLNRVPEKPPSANNESFIATLLEVLSNRQLVGFGTYLFWLYLFAGATIQVAILFAKLQLRLSDGFLVLVSSCMMIGAIIGFFIGGRSVDRRGTKIVFLLAHCGFGLLNFALLTVHDGSFFSSGLLVVIFVLYGMTYGSASVAVSSEALALAPEKNTEMSLAVCMGLYVAGIGASRFLAGWVLDSGMLAESWTFFGVAMSQYHTLFLVFGSGVIASCVLLSLVPSVVARTRLLPQVR